MINARRTNSHHGSDKFHMLSFITRGRPRLALFGPRVHIYLMPEDKPKRPWSGFAYLVIVVIAILIAYFLVYPVGQMIRNVFLTLTHALGG